MFMFLMGSPLILHEVKPVLKNVFLNTKSYVNFTKMLLSLSSDEKTVGKRFSAISFSQAEKLATQTKRRNNLISPIVNRFDDHFEHSVVGQRNGSSVALASVLFEVDINTLLSPSSIYVSVV